MLLEVLQKQGKGVQKEIKIKLKSMKQRQKDQNKEPTKWRAALWKIKQDFQTFSETDKRKEKDDPNS